MSVEVGKRVRHDRAATGGGHDGCIGRRSESSTGRRIHTEDRDGLGEVAERLGTTRILPRGNGRADGRGELARQPPALGRKRILDEGQAEVVETTAAGKRFGQVAEAHVGVDREADAGGKGSAQPPHDVRVSSRAP